MKQAKLSCTMDRHYNPVDQSCERYLLVSLQMPDALRQSERLPLNLSLIIDRSGSMRGNKLEYVKEAAIHVLRLLSEGDRISVVAYDDEVKVVAASTPVTSETRDQLTRKIQAIKPGGMTNLSGGWFTGCDQIADTMTSDYLNRALLLTDGLANQGMTDHEKLVFQAKELRKRGITTTTFGVGDDFNQFLLQGIADGGGGHFYFIERPKQIPDHFKGELGEMLATVAREMTLDVTLPEGIELTALNDIPTEQRAGQFRLLLGDAYAAESRTLVLKAQFPARPEEYSWTVPVTLRYEDAQIRQGVSLTDDSVAFMVADAATCESESVNQDVLEAASRLEAERAKMEALKREYEGDVEGAQFVLQRPKAT